MVHGVFTYIRLIKEYLSQDIFFNWPDFFSEPPGFRLQDVEKSTNPGALFHSPGEKKHVIV